LHGVSRSVLRLLNDEAQIGEIAGFEHRTNAIGLMSENQYLRTEFGFSRGGHDPMDHRLAAEFVENLRQIAFHARALAGRHYQSCAGGLRSSGSIVFRIEVFHGLFPR